VRGGGADGGAVVSKTGAKKIFNPALQSGLRASMGVATEIL
jgi:hypothetical protein